MVILAYIILYKERIVHKKVHMKCLLYSERDAHQEIFEHKHK